MPGVNFRATSGYVSDGSGETYSLGEVYPTTRGGLTFGFDVSMAASARNRSSSVDRRLAGINAAASPRTFRLNLPNGAGTYRVRVAVGDQAFDGTANLVIKDGTGTTKATISGFFDVARWRDINNVVRTEAQFVSEYAATYLETTFSQDFLTVEFQTAGTTQIAHIAVEHVAVDSTAPTLSSPTGAGGVNVCSGSVSTNEGNGTLYAVATASATAPSAAQVKAGQDHTGAAALRVVSQAVSGTGTQTVAGGAISGGAGTRYLHYMHEDAATNQSSVVSSSGFAVTVPLSVTLDALKDESDAVRASYTVTSIYAIRVSDGALVASWSGQTTDGSGVLPALEHAGLTAAPHLFVTYTATGTKAGAKVYTPA